MRDEHQSGVTAEARTEYEYNSSLERESAGMTRSSDAKNRVAESKNTLNNVERSFEEGGKAAVTAADATSSTGVESASKQNWPKMLSSFDSYVESETGNTRLRNILYKTVKNSWMRGGQRQFPLFEIRKTEEEQKERK